MWRRLLLSTVESPPQKNQLPPGQGAPPLTPCSHHKGTILHVAGPSIAVLFNSHAVANTAHRSSAAAFMLQLSSRGLRGILLQPRSYVVTLHPVVADGPFSLLNPVGKWFDLLYFCDAPSVFFFSRRTTICFPSGGSFSVVVPQGPPAALLSPRGWRWRLSCRWRPSLPRSVAPNGAPRSSWQGASPLNLACLPHPPPVRRTSLRRSPQGKHTVMAGWAFSFRRQ